LEVGRIDDQDRAPILPFDEPSICATHLYECSSELCILLTALTEDRAAEIAQNWYGTMTPPKTKSRVPNGRTQRRLAILKQSAELARRAKLDNKMLMLRVEYRKQR
jgi:hypothetical protein